MKKNWIPQKWRFTFLLVEVFILLVANRIGFGAWKPSTNPDGWWFYSTFLGLLLGKRLDTPFFAKPVDVALYALPSLAALIQSGSTSYSGWGEIEQWIFILAVSFCGFVAITAAIAIWTKPEKGQEAKPWSTAAKLTAESLGAPRVFFSVLFVLVLIGFNRSSASQVIATFVAWGCTVAFSPLDGSYLWICQVVESLTGKRAFPEVGEIAAYQTPGLTLIRQAEADATRFGDVLAVNDPLGKARATVALDHVGRDEGLLLRTIDVANSILPPEAETALAHLPPKSAVHVSALGDSIAESQLVKERETLVGLVAPDTTIETIYFEVVKDDGLAEGRLVEVQIGSRTVTFQVVNGLTKEDTIQQKNTHGYARAQGQKIGEWNADAKKFKSVKWLPAPNAPVFLKTTEEFAPTSNAVGHFPGTNYPVSIKKLDDLVTHNTAILGILGVGKSMLAIELVERMIAARIKVICVDLTNQYADELQAFCAPAKEAKVLAELQAIGAAGKTQFHQNVEEGGSREVFAETISEHIREFVDPSNPAKLKIFNPSQFEVWRQDSRLYPSGKASMASLTPAEITQIITESTLDATLALGMTDKARVCLVYEEAHSLIPEWKSTVNEGDQSASNGTARAILQGRKYGLGCILITQRTANVTKTILNQCNTIFAMRTFDDTGKEFLGNYIGKEYAASLPSLSERQAVLFGKASSCENPVLIRLNDRDKFLEAFRAENPPPPLPADDVPPEAEELTPSSVPPANLSDDDVPF